MQHVIFARDRKRKKNKIKALLFLMALFSIFIGIVLSLKGQGNKIPNSQPTIAATKAATKSAPVPNEIELNLAEGSPITAESTNKPKVELKKESEITGTDESANLLHGEPNYISIEISEADDDPVGEDDQNATSYEDELWDKDDVDDEATSDKVAQPVENAESQPKQAEENQQVESEEPKESEQVVSEENKDILEGEELVDETETKKPEDGIKLSAEAESVLGDFLDIADQAMRIQNQFSYTVTRGDKLKDVLEQSGIGASTARALERKFPQLASLQVGQQFYWILDNSGELEYMNWLVSEKEEKIFERKAKNQFAVQTIEKQGIWKEDVVRGTLNGNFASSLQAVGLSKRQIAQLASGLQWQIATNKMKKGDKFAILVKREYINGKVTDLGNVEAIHIISGKKSYYAIQAENGRYYSRHGETLGRGFARYPLQFTPRTSSQFNPRRLHPVTRRVAPHKGVDFAVPTGTLIIAPADGVVEHVAYQANGAGRYLKIRHAGQYTTVYMHLSKHLVRVGQAVKKGDRIALSGNTGRSTGAHLHYEFHINGHPVNPMTVKLPGTGSGMPEQERKTFLVKAKNAESKLKL
ncbi:peptidase M23 [Pasteurellaceae bacterium LFhippo2]|nr:peptidase M23 [Pasteurellaceae bacterium LFhippo2]